MPRATKRLCGDCRGTAGSSQRLLAASHSGRAMEVGGTSSRHKLVEEMERNHADTKICLCRHVDCDCFFSSRHRDCSSERTAPVVSISSSYAWWRYRRIGTSGCK